MAWKGVVIEESLEDRGLLKMVKVVRSEEATLEGEEGKGMMHLQYFELDEANTDKFISMARKAVKHGWYIHICRGGTMVVVFKGKAFEFTKAQEDAIQRAEDYGASIGILRGQMGFRKMIDNPWD